MHEITPVSGASVADGTRPVGHPAPTTDQPGYVLHRRPFRETSAIVELLTRDHGRLGAVVRGVRGGRRPRHSIEPFTLASFAWRGRGQLVTVTASESITAMRLTGDALFSGLYLNELLVKTLEPHDAIPDVFHQYGVTLAALAGDGNMAPALRRFERGLLEALGYGVVFDADIHSGAPIDAGKTYRFVDGEGFCEARADLALAASAGESQPVPGKAIIAMANDDYGQAATCRAAKAVFRLALQHRLGHRQLHTRRLFAARANGRAMRHSAVTTRS